MKKSATTQIIVFDGICALCNHSMQFIIKRDLHQQFYFVPFQSEAGTYILQHFQLDPQDMSSFLLIQQAQVLKKTAAWVQILYLLPQPWKLFAQVASIMPNTLLDKCYDFIGKRRYAWFGTVDYCIIGDFSIKQQPDITQIKLLLKC